MFKSFKLKLSMSFNSLVVFNFSLSRWSDQLGRSVSNTAESVEYKRLLFENDWLTGEAEYRSCKSKSLLQQKTKPPNVTEFQP